MERGRIQRLSKFFEYPLLSQERVKLRTSNLTRIFTEPTRIKPIKNFSENGAWAYPGTAQFFGYPLLSQPRVKLRTSNFVGTFIGSTGTKAYENIGTSGRGRCQGVPKIFRAPICRAHCAVIFAIAQLSCFCSCFFIFSFFSFLLLVFSHCFAFPLTFLFRYCAFPFSPFIFSHIYTRAEY